MVMMLQELVDDCVDLGVLSVFVGYYLWCVLNVFVVDFICVLDGMGICQVLFGIFLVVVVNFDINQGVVGCVLGIQCVNMVVLINELVDQVLIECCVFLEDCCVFVLWLSLVGQVKLEGCVVCICVYEEVMLFGLSFVDCVWLIVLLMWIEVKECS